ncbi:hypothetical protein HYU22_03440 [Candidatus Woesearchaeota archaeon]|nr:hypothetical protein [Candidatus Woesearchaeota archaeon]
MHQDPAHGIHVVVQDDPEFRDTISDLGYQVLAKMYHCTRQEAEDRFYRIQELVTNYHNQRLKMKKE